MKRNIYIMYAVALLQGMVFYAPIATLYRQAAGISIFQITLIESISMLLSILTEIPWGYAADRIGYRRTMILCGVMYFVSKVIFWKADSFAAFLLERILLGVICSGLSGVETSILFLSCKDGDSQHAFGVYGALGETGMLFSAVAFAVFVGDNYRMAAFLTVISYGISAVLLFGLREVKSQSGVKSRIRETFGMLGSLLKNRRMLFLLIAAAMIGETSHTITVFLNQPQYVRSAMSSEAIAVVFVVMTVAGIVSSALSDKITAKAGIKRLGIGIFGISALACACLAATKSAFLSAACIILLEITCGVFQPLQTEIQNREIKTDERATALSMNAVFMDGAAIFINLLFGKITDIGLPAAMMLGCFFYILSGAMFALSRRCGKQTE